MIRQSVARASSSAGVFNKNASVFQILNIPERCIIRTFCKLGIFRCVHMTFEIILKHSVDDKAQTLINGLLINLVPKLCLKENIAKSSFRARNGST